MKKKNRKPDSDFTFSPVPDSSRKAFLPMFFIMLGFTFTSASMSVGARLGNGLDLTGFLIAVAAGGAILSCYVGLLAYIGSDTRLSNITGVRKAPMVVAAGALIGNFVHHGISSINAMIAACVCYSVSAFAAHSKINRISSDLPQCRTLF